MLICLSAGTLEWDFLQNDFNWDKTDALPPTLKGVFQREPLWLRLSESDPDNPLRSHAAKVAAAVKGIELHDLISEESRIHRRNITTAALATLVLLLVTAGLLWSLYSRSQSLRTIFQQRQRITDVGSRVQLEERQKEIEAYRANIEQAYRYYSVQDLAGATSSLDASHPDLRSLEWYFLNSRLDDGTVREDFGEPSTCIDIRPDAKELAVCAPHGRVELISTGGEDVHFIEGGFGEVKTVRYSLDGTRLRVAYDTGDVVAWEDSAAKKPLDQLHLLPSAGQSDSFGGPKVSAAVVSRDGGLVVLTPSDGAQLLVRTRDSEIRKVSAPHVTFSSLDLGENGRSFVSGDWSGNVTLWRVSDLKPLATVAVGFKINSLSMAHSPRLVAAVGDENLAIVDLVAVRIISKRRLSYQGTFVQFNSAGDEIISGGGDNRLRIWTAKGTPVRELSGHRTPPRAAVFDPSSRTVYSVGESLRSWDLSRSDVLSLSIGYTKEAHLALSQDGSFLAVSDDRHQVHVFNMNNGARVALLMARAPVARLSFVADNEHLLIQSGTALANRPIFQAGDNQFSLWDLSSHRIVQHYELPLAGLTGSVLSRDGQYILADVYSSHRGSSFDERDYRYLSEPGGGPRSTKKMLLFDASTKDQLSAAQCDDHNLVAAECDATGRWCVTAHAYRGFMAEVGAPFRSFGALDILDRSSGATVRLFHHEAVRSISLSPASGMLSVAGDDGKISFIDLDGLQKVFDLSKARRDSLSTKGIPDFGVDTIDSVREDPVISTAIKRQTVVAHAQPITAIAFSPDGERVVSSSLDGTVKIFGVDGHGYATVHAGKFPILDLALARNGAQLAIVSADGNIRIWAIRASDLLETARLLTSKGNVLAMSNRACEALDLFNAAISRFRASLAKQGRADLQRQLVILLTNRGSALAQCGNPVPAGQDFNDAVQTAEAGFKEAPSDEWDRALRDALLERAVFLSSTDGYKLATSDLDRVVSLATQASTLDGPSTATDDNLARAFALRALIMLRSKDRSGAIRDFSKAVAAFEHMGDYRAPEVDLSFARCLHNRAIAYADSSNKEAALSDISRAIDIDRRLIDLGFAGATEDMNSSLKVRALLRGEPGASKPNGAN
jgi:WD40 repeat protein